MSHDRGCFVCYEDPPYTRCPRADCPKLGRGIYSPQAIEERRKHDLARVKRIDLARRQHALWFWRTP